ncbi:fusaric acid resistance protein [Ameyamaea chiangmaiensis NBRC 103196]|nr:FUSC family protein [Ameyamaea chiangmaiensis]GBQ66410.1 fusaric acid resistance protein [Ameyamaea chiangmaiensis NBRC 103196]
MSDAVTSPSARSERVAQLIATVFPPWDALRDRVFYSARALASIALALGLSFTFQLASPMSSVTTALIVANPTVGALLSKSVWRLTGTLIGAATAVVMMALFAQTSVLYMLVLSVLIGAACCVATLLRFFKAYAAVLAGYTIVIVSAPAFDDPNGIFLSAMSRLSAVTVGLASTAFVFLVTTVSRPSRVLQQVETTTRQIAALFEHASEYFGDAPDHAENVQETVETFREAPTTYYTERGRILAATGALVEAVEYAAADNFTISRRARSLRIGVSRLLGLVGAHHPAWQTLMTRDPNARDARARTREAMRLISNAPGSLLEAPTNPALLGQLDHALGGFDDLTQRTQDLYALAIIDSERQVLEQMRAALENLGGHTRDRARLRLLFEWPSAFRNAARGMFVTFIACMVWYVFRWQSGPAMLAYLVPASCLLATSPSATRVAVQFASGTMAAIPMAFVLQTWLLPQVDGFPLLVMCLAIGLLPGIWIQFHPRHAMRGFGYAVFLNAMVQVQNPSHYDDIALTNTWLAYLLAATCLVLVFRVVLPADQRLDCARLAQSVVRAIQTLARPAQGVLDPVVWENLQIQKIQRLVQRFSFVADARRTADVTDAALMALTVGRVTLRLRAALARGQLEAGTRAALLDAMGALSRVRRDPHGAADIIRDHARQILDMAQSATGPHAVAGRRVAGALLQISYLVGSAPGFFDRAGPLQRTRSMPGFDDALVTPTSWRMESGVMAR